MYTPNSPEDETNDALPGWHDPFPEPQTIPSGWDLSGILSTPMSAAMDADEGVED
jgi:hypothetical protein